MANPFLDDFLNELQESELEKTSFGGDFNQTSAFGADLFSVEEEIPQEEKNILWDIVGSSAWAFANEASFNLLGLGDSLLDTDLRQTPQSLAAKVGAGAGALAGFALGAPFKVGTKIGTMAAKPFLKKALTKELGEDYVVASAKNVAKEVSEKAMDQGLRKEIANDVTRQYLNNAQRAAFNKDIGKNFAFKTGQAIDDVAQGYLNTGKITEGEFNIITGMMKDGLTKRPLENFKDLWSLRSSSEKAGAIGNLIDEVVMFGTVDAIRELPASMADEREYDMMAPIWGTGIGLGFGALKFMSPAGKNSNFRVELVDGVKAAFGKNIYQNKSSETLQKYINLFSKQVSDNSEEFKRLSYIKTRYNGREFNVSLNTRTAVQDAIDAYGENTGRQVIAQALNTRSKEYGRELLQYALKEEWGSLSENWFRMMAGGLIMSAPNIYDMTANEADMPLEDLLPNILIGGWMNRKGTGRVWDLSTRTQEIRKNLNAMGFDTRNLVRDIPMHSQIPDFHNPIGQNETLIKAREKASELGIIVDDWESTRVPLEARAADNPNLSTESVLAAEQSRGGYDYFKSFYNILGGKNKFIRGLNEISVTEADEINKILTSTKWDVLNNQPIKNSRDADIVFESIAESTGGSVEEYIASALFGLQKGLGLDTNLDISKPAQLGKFVESFNLPLSTLDGSPTIRDLIYSGKAKDIPGFEGINGEDAVLLAENVMKKVNTMIDQFGPEGLGNVDPIKNKIFNLEDLDQFRFVKEITDTFEGKVNRMFPDRNYDFQTEIELPGLTYVMATNHGKTAAKKISHLFDLNRPGSDDLLLKLRSVGLMHGDVNQMKSVEDVSNIEIIGAGEKLPESKRLLSNILRIMHAKGGERFGSAAPEKILKAEFTDIIKLREFLKSRGMNTQPWIMDRWNNYTVRYLNQEAIEGSNLTMEDVNIMHKIIAAPELNLVKNSISGARGYELAKIDFVSGDSAISERMSRIANNWNEFVDDIKQRGGTKDASLIRDMEPQKALAPEVLDELSMILSYSNESTAISAKQALMDMFNSIDAPEMAFREQMDMFANSNPKYYNKLLSWMEELNIMERTEAEGYSRFNYKNDNLNDATIEILKERMNKFGHSYSEAEANLKSHRTEVMNMFADAYEPHIDDASLTQDQFFSKYFLSELGAKAYGNAEMQNLFLDNIIDQAENVGELSVPGWTGLRKMDKDGNLIPRKDLVGLQNIAKEYMFFKHKDKYVKAKDLDLSDPKLGNQFDEALDHFASLLTTRMNTVSKRLLLWDGHISGRTVSMQKTPMIESFDKIDLPFAFLSGTAENFIQKGGRASRQRFNIYESSADKLHPDDIEMLQTQRDIFNKNLGEIESINMESTKADLYPQPFKTGDGVNKGLHEFVIANGMQPIGIQTRHLPKIRKAYEDLYSKVKDKKSIDPKVKSWMKTVIREMKDAEPISGKFNKVDAHEVALRQFLFSEISISKGDYKEFNDLMLDNANLSGDIEKISKRLSLFHTPNFKRYNELVTRGTARDKNDQAILDKFLTSKKVSVGIWNDKNELNTSIKENLKKYLGDGFDDFWESQLYNRGDESPFDSISYISYDQMRFWSLAMGRASGRETQIFKPAISATGDALLLGKTVFIYDPHMDNFFKNNNMDILMTKSASKVMDRNWKMIESSEASLSLQKGLKSFARDIPLESIGIKQDRIHTKANAKLSQSSFNYLSSVEAQQIFGDFYGKRLKNSMNNLRKLSVGRDNVDLRRAFFDENTFDGQTIQSMFEGSGASASLGALRSASKFNIDPMEISENMVMTQFYKKLIDPIVNQTAVIDKFRYGGKAVLIQSLDPSLRTLRPTISRDGKTETYGEIMLPAYEMDSELGSLAKSKDNNMTIKIIDTSNPNNHEIKTLEDMGMDPKDVSKLTLEQFHNEVKALEGSYEVAIITNRYPRTRPNDMAILGLKGFLDKQYGNAMIVNEMDVLNIFEGDYDVDKNDYFFAHNKQMYDHIQSTAPIFTQGIDVADYAGSIEGLSLAGDNTSQINDAWRMQLSNGSVLKKGIGIVQKVQRTLNWMSDLASKNDDGMGDIIKLEDGTRIAMDYNNKDWWHRAVLETQAIIDAGTSIDGKLFRYMKEWKEDFLFPLKDYSKSSDDLKENGMGFLKTLRQGNAKADDRLRIFRKWDKTGTEVDLTDMDKDIIRNMLNEYSSFLNIGTQIFENTGFSKKPGYSDIINSSDSYFGFMSDINSNLFYRLKSKHGHKDEFKHYFKQTQKAKKVYNKEKRRYEDSTSEFYPAPGSSPFITGFLQQADRTSRGLHGNVFDRSMWQIKAEDPLRERKHREVLTGDELAHMESSLNRFIENPADKEVWNGEVMGFINNYNKAIGTLRFLNKRFGYINSQAYKGGWKKKQEILSGLKEQKEKVRQSVRDLLPEQFLKTGRTKDLVDANIKVLDIDSKQDLQDGAVQLYTMDAITRYDSGTLKMHEDIRELKDYERRAFADLKDLSHTMPLGGRQLLSEKQLEYAKNQRFDYNNVETVIDELLNKLVRDHGVTALFHYASLPKNKNAVGIFNNTVHVVPYNANGRLKRVLKYMIKRSDGIDVSMQNSLKKVGQVLSTYRNYFKKDWQNLSRTHIIDKKLDVTYEHLSFPDFHPSFETALSSYKDIKWSRHTTNNMDPFKLYDSQESKFYERFFEGSGLGGEYREYLQQKNMMQKMLMSTKLVDPTIYMSMLSKHNDEMHNFVSKRATGFKDSNGRTWPVSEMAKKALEGDPIYALLGGSKHFKGITLSPNNRMNKFDISSLREFSKQSKLVISDPVSEGKSRNVFQRRKNLKCNI